MADQLDRLRALDRALAELYLVEPETRGRPRTKPCGTYASYARGCRCDSCRAANTEYHRQRRANAPATT